MEESACIVCFSSYDDEKHRPRFMPCGHTICSHCLARAIREKSKTCPQCRTLYAASNVKDLPVNYSLEGIMKRVNITERLPECAEHQLQVSHRCSTHKAWICQNCIREDHCSESCKIIKISEELNIRKTAQLSQSQPFINIFDETCKITDDNKKQCTKLIEENNEDITQCETMVSRLQEEIRRKKNSKVQMEKMYAMFDKKLAILKGKRNFYDEAVTSLKSSETIKGVSRCSMEVHNQAEKLPLISQEMENEVNQMLQVFKVKTEASVEPSLVNHKVSVRNGKYHMHCLQENDPSIIHPQTLQITDEDAPALTNGILTFLDVAWPGKTPRRVYIKIINNSARARQHVLLVTGYKGLSYKDFDFSNNIIKKDQPGESMVIGPYNSRKSCLPLLNDVTINDGTVPNAVEAGLMVGARSKGPCNINCSICAFYLTDGLRFTSDLGFGRVTSGLNILQDVAKSDERDKIKIVDCGVVVFC